MERNSLETREEVSKLCSLTGNLQRMLDLGYSTLENDHGRKMMRETSFVKELVIPLFPLLKEKRNKEKSKAEPGDDQPTSKKIRELEIDIDHFLQASVNMINLTWAEKGKRNATWEVKEERRPIDRPIEGVIKLSEKPKAAIIKRVILCSRSVGPIIDKKLIKRRKEEEHENHMSIMRAAERETSRNVFQRFEGDSQPKNLSEVFRNYEVSEEVEDREA
ncbi:UDP-glycosyltransferase 85A2-like [Pyrus ussuriensis x Pyrus communis]|uniref:UDP-glycosyltransferase 85A2-like n=1 Tax=Pyrus ussuriensis x Pyrus communis TaxID=2448454 RepID=A0A5N5FEF1_9ROSA|nr:UDP-glycosyltransferase 85A2-like [Pyrus ussuriensis x Pyrus communis]